jgi:hypothetical protein
MFASQRQYTGIAWVQQQHLPQHRGHLRREWNRQFTFRVRTATRKLSTKPNSSCRLARVRTRKTSNAQIEAAAPPTPELRREGRLARIAKALASGATVTDIAEAEGIGRTLASREANSTECRELIAEFVGMTRNACRVLSIDACD